ncbi:hypothetical protein A3I27_02870 [Candidatus Giovannonibacteria bacterium RIFCSPLOWO2_02_FULL_43_11b]|uniref:Uncharacterized protein n=1 Tax=Candidatus Giovannonibacteria bacterium RIFCSPHIGHO2_12_FULL_43_15 TaxID=1798341 RepID=A0A1F5WR54_9BACT|nr:MAG: hypothetical protein A3B97_01165 [Candidatus Giovannonibacteria bacterium RIFCSPHIGHO2_02_FULL_43_32]OGF78084.1 MAG: hypothetical protein A3F23_02680 [Candidatus Giovannonibacteria bacterium RIFCSPHIGHO2_12_FULL_43_15]OGF78827.1 MAG: hypothetical protein A3A15_00370 [Candidatus Giovannonibacteria bacterium RIFCSPLOWO2_01_FULL_43_60]OGF89152.1 MAG: hypothetical protein A3I27_02870 [Candidatus Giovannonibacteria bacterium RIFCSPLOWO2_02_FULL_43_11b]
MTGQVLIRKLNKEVLILKEEMRGIKKILFAPIKDPEGEYRKDFVKKILARAKENPKYRFTTKEEFMAQVYERKE